MENTLPAFSRAWEQGADGVELDVHLSRDGQIVVFHDAYLERLTEGEGRVADHDAAALSRLPFRRFHDWKAIHIPTLDDIARTMPDDRKLFIEVKCGTEIVAPLVSFLERYPGLKSRIRLLSFDPDVAEALEEGLPGTGVYINVAPGDPIGLELAFQRAARKRLEGISIGYHSGINHEVAAMFHRNRFGFAVWTVNDIETARTMRDIGVDFLMTDYPARMMDGLKSSVESAG